MDKDYDGFVAYMRHYENFKARWGNSAQTHLDRALNEYIDRHSPESKPAPVSTEQTTRKPGDPLYVAPVETAEPKTEHRGRHTQPNGQPGAYLQDVERACAHLFKNLLGGK